MYEEGVTPTKGVFIISTKVAMTRIYFINPCMTYSLFMAYTHTRENVERNSRERSKGYKTPGHLPKTYFFSPSNLASNSQRVCMFQQSFGR